MEKFKFRPHHIFCLRFLKLEFPERGEKYRLADQKMHDIFMHQDDVLVEAAEGGDDLCRSCPNLQDGRCQSPKGSEDAVRKWDHLILKGLGLSYGHTMSSRQWAELIAQKAPLELCQTRCPKKQDCSVFAASSRATDG